METRDYMKRLFDSFGDTEAVTRDMLIAQADLIREISAKCRKTKLFRDSEEFVTAIEQDDQVEDRLIHAWTWVMDRIVRAPTSFHIDGAVVLTMPLVERYLPETGNGEKPSGIILIPECEDYAPVGSQELAEIVRERPQWPEGATCATQEADGEVLFWNAPVDTVKEGRRLAGKHGMVAQLGIAHQIDSWYAEGDALQLARDWSTAVVTSEQCNITPQSRGTI